MENKRTLITGSFDPPTLGHLDIIKRASSLFDEVTVCLFKNSDKKYMFSEEVRLNMLREMCKDITLPTKVRLFKAVVFPVVMYGFELDYKESCCCC